jgi:hypothetical protein
MLRRFAVLGSVAWLLVPHTSSAQLETIEGEASGPTSIARLPTIGLPLLDSFVFRYTDDDDRHFGTMKVAWEGRNVALDFADEGDPPYAYEVSHHRLLGGGDVEIHSEEGSCDGTCTVRGPLREVGTTFVLIGFELASESDFDLKEVGIWETRNGAIRIDMSTEHSTWSFLEFWKDHDQPRFDYSIQYAYLPDTLFVASDSARGDSGENKRAIAHEIPAGPSVVTGFSLEYASGDHHVREIGIDSSRSGELLIRLSERGFDEKFEYRVDWAILESAACVGCE